MMKPATHLNSAVLILCLACGAPAGCASLPPAAMTGAPNEVWQRLEEGKPQDLIVTFDDAAIRERVGRVESAPGISREEAAVRFRIEQYAALKKSVLSALPAGEAEVLRDYDALPLMFIRFRSAAALKALLAHPSVLRTHEDRRESLMPGRPGR